MDEEGFLYVTGRKKNLIILSNGENVSPEELEEKIMQFPYVKEVIVSECEGQIQAEIYPEEEMEIEEKFRQDVHSLKKTLPNYKKITKIKIRKEKFEKTSTRKIKRKETNIC